MGNWPPSNLDTLRSVAEADQFLVLTDDGKTWQLSSSLPGKGIFVCDPQYLLSLERDGLIEPIPQATKIDRCKVFGSARLTDKGREAMQMLNGHRKVSNYAMPGWLLAEITR